MFPGASPRSALPYGNRPGGRVFKRHSPAAGFGHVRVMEQGLYVGFTRENPFGEKCDRAGRQKQYKDGLWSVPLSGIYVDHEPPGSPAPLDTKLVAEGTYVFPSIRNFPETKAHMKKTAGK